MRASPTAYRPPWKIRFCRPFMVARYLPYLSVLTSLLFRHCCCYVFCFQAHCEGRRRADARCTLQAGAKVERRAATENTQSARYGCREGRDESRPRKIPFSIILGSSITTTALTRGEYKPRRRAHLVHKNAEERKIFLPSSFVPLLKFLGLSRNLCVRLFLSNIMHSSGRRDLGHYCSQSKERTNTSPVPVAFKNANARPPSQSPFRIEQLLSPTVGPASSHRASPSIPAPLPTPRSESIPSRRDRHSRAADTALLLQRPARAMQPAFCQVVHHEAEDVLGLANPAAAAGSVQFFKCQF